MNVPPDQPAVRGEGLMKSFGRTEVLRGVDIAVRPGESVCVWGPSGSGKSTLLHVLGLMTPAAAGRLWLFGRDVEGMSDDERSRMRNERLGFLFQFHHLLADLTLEENVALPLLLQNRTMPDARRAAGELLDKLGLARRRDHRPSQTSGGEQQRAALARALVAEPGIVFADEPTGNLDRSAGRMVEDMLTREVKERGAALILVTHNEELAGRCDRRLVLEEGRLQGDMVGAGGLREEDER